jgi:hypothetical protein
MDTDMARDTDTGGRNVGENFTDESRAKYKKGIMADLTTKYPLSGVLKPVLSVGQLMVF